MTGLPENPTSDQPGDQPVGTLASVSLDCADAPALAAFYSRLLGLREVFRTPDDGIVSLSDGGIAVTMMRTPDYRPPTWPAPERPQQLHLDIAVDDLEPAVARAVSLGATPDAHQPAPEAWRVLRDPAGHPFCLTTVRPD